jgi:hypothetical protein
MAAIASTSHIVEFKYQWPTRYIGNKYKPVIASIASTTFRIVRNTLSELDDFSSTDSSAFLAIGFHSPNGRTVL